LKIASTALSDTGRILPNACLSDIPGPEIPNETGFCYLIDNLEILDATAFVITSSCFVCPLITAPNVTIPSTSYFAIKYSRSMAYQKYQVLYSHILLLILVLLPFLEQLDAF